MKAYFILNSRKCFILLFSVFFILAIGYFASSNFKIVITNCYQSEKSPHNEMKATSCKLDAFIQSISNISDEQQLIDIDILTTTIQFMIEERTEDDPELVEFVRSLIVSPKSDLPLKLDNMDMTNAHRSQFGQSEIIDDLLKAKRDGFFIEAGGFDGEKYSNTLFFELNRDWNGILIEPIPSYFKKIVEKNRQIYVINACIANKRPMVAKFRLGDVYSGRMSEMNENQGQVIEEETRTKVPKLAYVPCFSLQTILKAIQVEHVDYFSLDVEGGEMDILKSIDFDKIDITTFSVEHNRFEETKKDILDLMISKNYTLHKDHVIDFFFVKT